MSRAAETPLPPSAPRRVALVTGAARRVGRAIALELAAHGWDVAVHHHRSIDAAQALCAELQATGVRAAPVAADLADDATVAALLPQAVAALGQVDALVNNASLFEFDDAASFAPALAQRHYAVNVVAPVRLAQALHAHLRERGTTGCVVNLLDQKLHNPDPDYLSYTLSKAALQAATVALAQALAPRLRVVGVAPGLMLPSGPMTEAEFARVHDATPLSRGATPQDVAQAVRWLLDAPAVTGCTVLVDGGQHLAGSGRDLLFVARAAAAPA